MIDWLLHIPPAVILRLAVAFSACLIIVIGILAFVIRYQSFKHGSADE